MDNNVYRLILLFTLAVLLPIVITWLRSRRRINETNRRADIVIAALEKNPDVDVEDLLRKVSPKQKLLKEKLLRKLLWACILTIIATPVLIAWILAFVYDVQDNPSIQSSSESLGFAIIMLAVGIALFINYFVGKRLLAKEIEAEQQEMINRD
jgi:hypothetical protein